MNTKLEHVFVWSFYLLLFLLPLNLGKHFVFSFSYVDGVLLDYWIPTIFIQDLLIGFFLVLGIFLHKFSFGLGFYSALGLFAINFIFSTMPLATFIYILRLALYLLFCVLVSRSRAYFDTSTIIKVLCVSFLLTCFLALAQWVKQASFFNNYLFFGEQPYAMATSGILKQYVFDNIVISPYATFRHPNALAGFTSILLVTFTYYLHGVKKHIVLFIGSIVLFLTFSYAAWVSYIFGLLLLSSKKQIFRTILYTSVFLLFTIGLFGFFNLSFFGAQHVHRRFLLTAASAHTFVQNPLFGSGLNTSAFTGKDLSYLSRELNFFQPVHNIFWLLLSEGGLVLFVPFTLLYLCALFRAKSVSPVLPVVLLQFVILGSFDHYLLTMHQTLLLFMLTISFSIHYTFRHEI